MEKYIAATAIAVIFIGLGAAMLFVRKWMQDKANAAAAWPRTRGRIVSSEMRVFRGKQKSYKPVISYTYELAGQSYTGNRINFGVATSYNRALVEAQVATYAPGSEVDVHYDPHRPEKAVLEVAAGSNQSTYLILAAVFIVMGVVLGGVFLTSA